MENREKVTIRNGLKKTFIAYKDIDPVFSAMHTKLCADGLELSQDLLYMLGNGYARKVKDNQLILFNDTFINDLCACLGIYLEDYENRDEQHFFEEVRRNSRINIAPPMCYVKYGERDFLSIVCCVYDDHSYDVISPVTKEVVRVNYNDINYKKPWYMMNSPRFMNPKFREINQMVEESLYRLCQKMELYKSDNMKKMYITDENQVKAKMAEDFTERDFYFREFFLKSLKIVHEGTDLIEVVNGYEKILYQYTNLGIEKDARQAWVEELYDAENMILLCLKKIYMERKEKK